MGRDTALTHVQGIGGIPCRDMALNSPGESAGKRKSSFLLLKHCRPVLCMLQCSLHRA